MTKKLDPDVRALKGAIKALDQSTSPGMLKANLEFLWDRYIRHPSPSNTAQKHALDIKSNSVVE